MSKYVQEIEIENDIRTDDYDGRFEGVDLHVTTTSPLSINEFLITPAVKEELRKLGYVRLTDLPEVTKPGEGVPLFAVIRAMTSSYGVNYSFGYGKNNVTDSLEKALDCAMTQVGDGDVFITQAINTNVFTVDEKLKKKWEKFKNRGEILLKKQRAAEAKRKAKAAETEQKRRQKKIEAAKRLLEKYENTKESV